MRVITKDTLLKRELHAFKEAVLELLEDPIMTGPLDQAVTLFPCGHHLSQEVAEKVFKQNQQCPLDNQKIKSIIASPLLRDLAHLSHQDVYDFDHLLRKKFSEIGSNSLLTKAITLFPCGHSTTEEKLKTLNDTLCPLDQIKITCHAPDYTLRDMAAKVAHHEEALHKLYAGKPSFYPQLINPKTPLEDLMKIPLEDFLKESVDDPDNAMLCYNTSRILDKDAIVVKDGTSTPVKQALLEKLIRLEPTFADGYYELALCLGKEKYIKNHEGGSINGLQLLCQAIQWDPNHAKSYFTIALEWSECNGFDDKNGFSITGQDILIKAIHLNPPHAKLYARLGFTLDLLKGTVTLLDGRTLNRKELFEISIQLDPNSPASYYMRCEIGAMLFNWGAKNKKEQEVMPKIQQLYFDAISLNPSLSTAYRYLSGTLKKEEKIQLPDGSSMTGKDLLLKAIDLDPNNSVNYFLLSQNLSSEEKITLLNDTVMTGKEISLKGLAIDSPYDFGWLHLSKTLPPSEKIALPNGDSINQAQLLGITFSKALSAQGHHAMLIFENFINGFPPGQTIQLEDGSIKSEKEVYQMVIEKYPHYFLPYYKLGHILDLKEKIQLSPTVTMDKEALFLKAILLNPEDANSYQALGSLLPKGKIVTLTQGKKMNGQQLLLESIRLSPHQGDLYYQLGISLPIGKTVELPSKEKMHKIDLFLKTIELKPQHVKAHCALAETLPLKGSIQLPNGEKKSKPELYLKALELNPTYEEFILIGQALAYFFKKKEPLKLSNGKILPYQDFQSSIKKLFFHFFEKADLSQLSDDPFFQQLSSFFAESQKP
ncbi:MAG: hypothetical protein QRY71_05060 [Candidatus Rhabdochlamydia sp.]